MLSPSFPLRRSKSSSGVSITSRPPAQVHRDRLSPNSQRHAQAAATAAFQRAQSRDQLRPQNTGTSQASSAAHHSTRAATLLSSTSRPGRTRAHTTAALISTDLRTPSYGRLRGQSSASSIGPPIPARSMSINMVATVQPRDSLDLLLPPAVPGRRQSMQNMALNVLHESVPSMDTLPQYSPGLRRQASQRSVRTAGRHQVLEMMPELGASSSQQGQRPRPCHPHYRSNSNRPHRCQYAYSSYIQVFSTNDAQRRSWTSAAVTTAYHSTEKRSTAQI